AETRREESGVKFSAAWRSTLKSWLEPAYQAVGEQARAVAWNAGRRLSMEQAVAFALEATDYPATAETATPLSPREEEVAILITRGFTNRQIADVLMITRRTANSHVEHIFNKLGFNSRSQVAAWVVERGIGRAGRD